MKKKYKLKCFIYRQIACQVMVLKFDKIFGKILASYILLNMPLNTLITSGLICGIFASEQRTILIEFILGQILAIFGIHLLAAVYEKRLHQPVLRFISKLMKNNGILISEMSEKMIQIDNSGGVDDGVQAISSNIIKNNNNYYYYNRQQQRHRLRCLSFSLLSSSPTTLRMSIRELIFMSNYIQTYYTVNPYGITYGGVSLITMHSFLKVILSVIL